MPMSLNNLLAVTGCRVSALDIVVALLCWYRSSHPLAFFFAWLLLRQTVCYFEIVFELGFGRRLYSPNAHPRNDRNKGRFESERHNKKSRGSGVQTDIEVEEVVLGEDELPIPTSPAQDTGASRTMEDSSHTIVPHRASSPVLTVAGPCHDKAFQHSRSHIDPAVEMLSPEIESILAAAQHPLYRPAQEEPGHPRAQRKSQVFKRKRTSTDGSTIPDNLPMQTHKSEKAQGKAAIVERKMQKKTRVSHSEDVEGGENDDVSSSKGTIVGYHD